MGVRADVQMTLRFGDVLAQVEAGVVRGMNKASEQLLADSIDVAPQQTRAMVGNAQAVHASNIEEPASVVYDSVQATRLHEHPEYNFSTDVNPNAQGKYLEEPAIDNRATYGDIIRTEARGA